MTKGNGNLLVFVFLVSANYTEKKRFHDKTAIVPEKNRLESIVATE